MDDRKLGRRNVLRGAAGVGVGTVAVTGLGVAVPAMAEAATQNGGRELDGSWLVIRQDDGDPTRVQTVISFADGGVIISHDISPAGPPFTGTWEQHGDRFRATIWTGFPGEGGPGTAGQTLRVRIRGTRTDGALSGSYEFTVFDPAGNVVDSGTGRFFNGRRINA
jgi:hypothetical protein